MNTGVIKIPGNFLRLGKHFGRLFGVAAVLVGEALAV